MKIIRIVLTALYCLCIATPGLHAQVPQLINYQGRVAVGNVNFNGAGQFKFALVNPAGSTTYWSNDGTSTGGSQPVNPVPLTVSSGLYSTLLGDTSLPNMTAIPTGVFGNPDVRLRVWFNDGTNGFQLLSPDQRLAPTSYLADGAVTTAKIAPGAVGPLQVNASIPLLSNSSNIFTGTLGVNNGLTVSGPSTFANDLTLNDKLTVAGLIRSSAGGVMFPDSTIQKSASSITSFFNVRNYGAVGNGSSDDTPAFLAALQSIRQSGGGTLFVPKGVYQLTSQLTIDVSVSLLGEGRRLSILRWQVAGGGVRFEGGAIGGRLKRTFAMTSLSLTTAVSQGGRAVEATSTVGVGNIGKTLDIRDCDFYTDSPSAYWDCCLWLDNIRDTTIANCDFRGRELPFSAGGIGIRIGGNLSPTTHCIDDCLFVGLDTAISVVGTIEGVVVSKCVTVGNRGIVWDTDQARPLLVVSNSHFDTVLDGVFVNNGTDTFIHHCLFYPRAANPGDVVNNRAGVVISGGSGDVRVSECKFHRTNPPDNYNAVLVVANATRVCIENNTIIGARTGIWLNAGSTDSCVLDNIFSLCFTNVLNQGSATRLREIPLPLP